MHSNKLFYLKLPQNRKSSNSELLQAMKYQFPDFASRRYKSARLKFLHQHITTRPLPSSIIQSNTVPFCVFELLSRIPNIVFFFTVIPRKLFGKIGMGKAWVVQWRLIAAIVCRVELFPSWFFLFSHYQILAPSIE